MNALRRAFPFVDMIRDYRREWARDDVTAGLTTAVMLIPQAMAYAMLAGLPPIIGLYASTLPLIVYALMGSSRVLAVGPVAMVSLLVASGLAPLADGGSVDYVVLAAILAFMVGVIQLGLGLLRAGFLVNFLGHPVVSGFTSAAALVIGFSQLGHLLGIELSRSHHVHSIVTEAIHTIGELNPITFAIGATSVVALIAMKHFVPRWPRALILVAGATLVVWGFGLHEQSVAIVGDVPAGLPSPSLPTVGATQITALLPTAVIISLVSFMESISVAKAFAKRSDRELDPNRELVGLGLANLTASVLRGYPVTGGFSRTAVNAQAGAQTRIAGIVAAGVVAVTLVFFTDLFFYLPKAVLAAVIMTAVFGLVDIKEARHLWAVDRADLVLLALTFFGTLIFGIEAGIGIGVGASLLWFVARTTRPHVAVLGRLPGTTHWRNVERFSDARPLPGALVLRMDASFYFGNVEFLRGEIDRRLDGDTSVDVVVLDANGINRLDSSAAAALGDIERELSERGVELRLAAVKGPVRDRLARCGLTEAMGMRAQFVDVDSAATARSERDRDTVKRARRDVSTRAEESDFAA